MLEGLITGLLVISSSVYVQYIVHAKEIGINRIIFSVPVIVFFLLLSVFVDARTNVVSSIIVSAFLGWWANFKVCFSSHVLSRLCCYHTPLLLANGLKTVFILNNYFYLSHTDTSALLGTWSARVIFIAIERGLFLYVLFKFLGHSSTSRSYYRSLFLKLPFKNSE